MTTKAPANAAYDSAREEERRRALSELHLYIDGLEREARANLERAAAAERERDALLAGRRDWQEQVEREAYLAEQAHALSVEREHDEAMSQLRRDRDGLLSCKASWSDKADEMRRERDEAQRNAKAWADERDAMRRERDEARAQLAALRDDVRMVLADFHPLNGA